MNKHIQKLNFGLDCMMVLLTLILLWSAEAIGMLGVLLLPLMVLPASVLTEENRYAALLFNTVLPAVLILFLPFPHLLHLLQELVYHSPAVSVNDDRTVFDLLRAHGFIVI